MTLASLCGDSAALEWILARDRRKAVQHAALANPALDVEVLWNPERGAWAFRSGDHTDHLADRIDDVGLDGRVAILTMPPAQSSSRLTSAVMRGLDADGLEATLDAVYTTTARRWQLDPATRLQVNNSCTHAALRRAANPDDPLRLSRRLVEAIVANTAAVTVGQLLCCGVDTAAAGWFLDLAGRYGVFDDDGAWADDRVRVDMARRRGMPEAWYRTAVTGGGSRVADALAENPDVDVAVLRAAPSKADVAFVALCTSAFGDDPDRWELALESRFDDALRRLGDLIDYVACACA